MTAKIPVPRKMEAAAHVIGPLGLHLAPGVF